MIYGSEEARTTPKVVAAFAECGEFDKVLMYSKQVCLVLNHDGV